MGVDGAPPRKQKSSGVNVFTGTGSTSWAYNIDQLPETTVAQVLNIGPRLPLLASLLRCTFAHLHTCTLARLHIRFRPLFYEYNACVICN